MLMMMHRGDYMSSSSIFKKCSLCFNFNPKLWVIWWESQD